MKVFGPVPWGNWGEKVTVPTPVGVACSFCEEPVLVDDLGVLMPHVEHDGATTEKAWHRDCVIHSIFGRPEDRRPTRRASAAATRARLEPACPRCGLDVVPEEKLSATKCPKCHVVISERGRPSLGLG